MNIPTRSTRAIGLLLLCSLVFASAPALAQFEWPQQITAPEGTIVVYQPQPESLAGNVLSGAVETSAGIQTVASRAASIDQADSQAGNQANRIGDKTRGEADRPEHAPSQPPVSRYA